MILPDANLILYAYDLESPFHTVAAAWWTKCLGEAEPVGLAQVILLLRPPIKKGIIDREPSEHSEREVIIKRLTPPEVTWASRKGRGGTLREEEGVPINSERRTANCQRRS
jgi:predicted nucleic acid-binding protein